MAPELITLAVTAAAAALLFWNRRQLADAIENLRNNFPRGGPPTPMHPSPAGDSELLRRKPAKRD